MNNSAKVQLLLLGIVLAFSSIFQMGYSNAYPNTSIESFRTFLNNSLSYNDHPFTESSFNWIWSTILNVYFAGFAVGSWISVPLADKIGRKWGLVIGNSLNFLSAVIATFSIVFSLPWLFLVNRIIFAISAAISMNSLILLLQESSPAPMRGLMSFNAEMAFVIMNLVGALAGMRSVLGNNLVWLVGVSCFPTFLSIIIALCFHESPKFLILERKDTKAAEQSLQFYQKIGGQEAHILLLAIEREKTKDDGSFYDLFHTPHLRKGLLLGVITLQLTTSIWPVLYFSTEFLNRANISYENAEVISTTMLFLSSISTLLGMSVVERLPRRFLLLSCGLGNMLALLLFVICSQVQPYYDPIKYGCIVAVIFHGISYSIALGPIAWFVTAELVPLQYRALSQSLALSLNQIIALLLSFVTLPLYNILGSLIFIPLFIIPGLVALVILFFCLPETRAREIDDIIKELKGGQLYVYEIGKQVTDDDI